MVDPEGIAVSQRLMQALADWAEDYDVDSDSFTLVANDSVHEKKAHEVLRSLAELDRWHHSHGHISHGHA